MTTLDYASANSVDADSFALRWLAYTFLAALAVEAWWAATMWRLDASNMSAVWVLHLVVEVAKLFGCVLLVSDAGRRGLRALQMRASLAAVLLGLGLAIPQFKALWASDAAGPIIGILGSFLLLLAIASHAVMRRYRTAFFWAIGIAAIAKLLPFLAMVLMRNSGSLEAALCFVVLMVMPSIWVSAILNLVFAVIMLMACGRAKHPRVEPQMVNV